MKTVISSKTGKVLEMAKQAFYSLQVLSIGFFIAFLFVFGISYHAPKTAKPSDETYISKPKDVSAERVVTVDFNKILSDKNS